MDFIVKQALGGATKDLNKMMDKGSEEADPKQLEAEKEHLEAMEEQEAERKEKHRKFEESREKERQRIRNKYGLKRKDELEAEEKAKREEETEGRLTRDKKPSMELQEEEEEESMTSYPLYYDRVNSFFCDVINRHRRIS
ncbi:unnamed protein product [Clavelina lepadiformis]|uniref:Complexin n=1 Tax=Clavelina lepadiformis TaxID=159417 RepID=A0ABP0G8F3_CLALP